MEQVKDLLLEVERLKAEQTRLRALSQGRRGEGAQCIVLADDLTGANDAALEFTLCGLSTSVIISGSDHQGTKGFDVVLYDTDSRNCSRAEAVQRNKALCSRVALASEALIYFKVDSTLRGTWGTGIATVMEESQIQMCVLAAALLGAGRTTIGGYQLLNGIPVARCQAGKDALCPLKSSSIPTLLKSSADLEVVVVGLETVELGSEALATWILQHMNTKTGKLICVCDAVSDDDMKIITDAAAQLCSAARGRKILLAGSAGLVPHIPPLFNMHPKQTKPSSPQSVDNGGGPILLVSGSSHPLNKTQLETLETDIGDEIVKFTAMDMVLGLNKPATSDDIVVLISDFDQHPFEKFVSCAADYCRKLRPSALCVTGGATLSAILQALGATSLTVESGVAANTPLCRVVGGQFDGLTVVSKAGGLGPDDVWVSAVFLI
jgi:uncharacterized protein YgbK (DUF1537 family)